MTLKFFGLWQSHLTEKSISTRLAKILTRAHSFRSEGQFAEAESARALLTRLRSMDLFLYTLPYKAGTAASDALWACLPVVTCVGQAFPGRYAASILKAIDLPELIAASAADYEDWAVRLALNSGALSAFRQKLASGLAIAPLFNTALVTRN